MIDNLLTDMKEEIRQLNITIDILVEENESLRQKKDDSLVERRCE